MGDGEREEGWERWGDDFAFQSRSVVKEERSKKSSQEKTSDRLLIATSFLSTYLLH